MSYINKKDDLEEFNLETKKYLESIRDFIGARCFINEDYHRYFHHISNRAKAKLSEEEKKKEKRLKKRIGRVKLCKFCGCRKSSVVISKVKVAQLEKRRKKKMFITRCGLCKRLDMPSALGKPSSDMDETCLMDRNGGQ